MELATWISYEFKTLGITLDPKLKPRSQRQGAKKKHGFRERTCLFPDPRQDLVPCTAQAYFIGTPLLKEPLKDPLKDPFKGSTFWILAPGLGRDPDPEVSTEPFRRS